MTLTIRYYGILTDITTCEKESVVLSEKSSLDDLSSSLIRQYPGFKAHSIVYFANGKKIKSGDILTQDSEIDCMPPFSGG